MKNISRAVLDKKILRNAKDLPFEQAVYKAFPDAKDNEEFGVTACGEDLLVRRFEVESEQDVLELANRKYPNGCPDCDSDKVIVIRRERFIADPKAKTVKPEDDGAFYDYDVLCGNDNPCGFITVE